MFEASSQSQDRVSKHNVPYLASADRQNSNHNRMFNTSCRALHPLIDRPHSSTTRMFKTAPRLGSNDHQNPIIHNLIAHSPRRVLYPLIDRTQATNRLFHASCRTSIRTSSIMVLLVEAQFGSTIYERCCCCFGHGLTEVDVYVHNCLRLVVQHVAEHLGVRLPASPPPPSPRRPTTVGRRGLKSPKTPRTQLREEESEKCREYGEKKPLTAAKHRQSHC